MQYELFYLIGASKKEAALENIKTQVEDIVKNEGGIFLEKEVIEKRKLAYAIKHESHGFYLARRFDLEEKDKLREISKKINLYPEVLRFILSRAENLPELKTKEERIQKSQAESARATEQERLIKENLSAQKEKTAALSQKPQTKLEKTEENIDTQLKELLNI